MMNNRLMNNYEIHNMTTNLNSLKKRLGNDVVIPPMYNVEDLSDHLLTNAEIETMATNIKLVNKRIGNHNLATTRRTTSTGNIASSVFAAIVTLVFIIIAFI